MSDAISGAARTPLAEFWRQFRRSPLAVAGAVLLLVLYAAAAFAPFVAPYGETGSDRERFFQPPQPLRWVHADGRVSLRPFVYAMRPEATGQRYREDRGRALPLRFFVKGVPYRLFGVIPWDRHLYGVDAPDRVYLLGADMVGRDLLGRALFGAQVSLTVGLIGIAVSFTLGLLLGGIAGYHGGWVDALVMRFTELLLSIPGLYLILALRGVFPAQLPSRQTYLAIVAILSLLGWAGLARVIRGMVLSLRRSEYVLAAEALGLGRMRILWRHILPNTMSFVIVAATVAVPGYILGEVFLSFLGVGVQPPAASWGNMLNDARGIRAMTSFPWMLFTPAVAVFVTVMAFNFFGDGLRDALDPRRNPGGR